MKLDDQIKKIFYELFDISGFDEKAQNEMVEKIAHIWLIKSSLKILELFSDEEKNKFYQLLKPGKSESDKDRIQKELFKIVSALDKVRYEKSIEIFYNEAGNIVERMIQKFNLKSTPQQKQEYAKRISTIFKNRIEG